MYKKFLILLIGLFLISPVFSLDYSSRKLPSGQTVIIMNVAKNPTVMLDTWVRTGSCDEDATNSGVAHFLEHLFFKGTEKNPTGVFNNILESKGGVVNAATSKDFTHFYINLPSKDFDKALELHSDMLLNPLVPRKELERERFVVLEEISKNLDSAENVAYNNLLKIMYSENAPYYRPVIGDKNVIQNITRDEILKFYKTYYLPSNMTTVVVGDVREDEVIKKIEEAFSLNSQDAVTTSKPIKTKKINKKDIQQNKKIIVDKQNKKLAYMYIGYRTLPLSGKKDVYTLDVLSKMLGDTQSSILNQKLKKQKEIVNSISTTSYNMAQDGIFMIDATMKPKNVDIVQENIYSEIEKIKDGDFSERDIEKSKNLIETDTYYSRESISNIAQELGYYATLGHLSLYDNYLDGIKKVKKKDIIRVAKKYFNKDDAYISIILPHDYEPVIKKTSDGEVHKADIIEKNSKAIKYQLDNQSKLVIEKNSDNSIIAINIHSRGGKFLEEIPGVSNLAALTALEGTNNYSAKELSELLDERGIKIDFQAGADTFSINVLTTKNELENAFLYLDEIVNSAIFPEDEINKAKNNLKTSLMSLSDRPTSMALDSFKGIAFENSKYGINSKIILQNIDKITRDDILNYYKKVLSSQNIDITVVGDVDDEKIINYFSSLFKKNSNPTLELRKMPYTSTKIKQNTEKIISKKDTNTSWIFLGYKTTEIYNEKDIAVLHVINAILGEGMNSRLFKNLREDEGLAYVVGSTIQQNALDGVFMAYIGTNPNNINQAKQGILNEFRKLKTEYVMKTELEQAKDKILGNLLISLETNMDEASLLGWYLTSGRNLEFFETYKKNIMNVTSSDILEVANKYFDKPYIMTVIKP